MRRPVEAPPGRLSYRRLPRRFGISRGTSRTGTSGSEPAAAAGGAILKNMSVGALVTLEEYLNTTYSPDREFVDGVVVERNVGERPHSYVQARLIMILGQRYPNVFVWPEWRERTVEARYRVPDVCVTLRDPGTDVLEEPPFLAIEILSKRDEMSDVLEKLEEYAVIGVPNIWLIDPRRQKAFTFAAHCLEEATGGTLATGEPVIRVSLEELFRGL